MSALAHIAAAVTTLLVLADEEDFDETSVTPGVEGFFVTFIVAALVILIIWDMNRRVRRMRYREEIREKLRAEQDATGTPPEL